MFSRISYDEFQLLFPVIGFFLFAAVFVGAVIKVALMKKSSIHRLAALPLEEGTPDEAPCCAARAATAGGDHPIPPTSHSIDIDGLSSKS